MLRSLFFLLAALCFILGPDSSLGKGGGPKMVVNEKNFDFGPVDQWEMVEHDFLIENQGDVTLRIEKVSPD